MVMHADVTNAVNKKTVKDFYDSLKIAYANMSCVCVCVHMCFFEQDCACPFVRVCMYRHIDACRCVCPCK